MSTATFVEVSIVIESRYGAEGLRDLDLFVDQAGIEPSPWTWSKPKWRVARSAALAKGDTQPDSTMATVSPMPSR